MSPRESGATRPVDLPEHAVARRRVRFVAVVLVAEALALFAFACFLLANLLGGSEETTETRNTVIETVMFFVMAVLLALLGRAAWRAVGWARAPIMVTQLIAFFGVGINLVQGDVWYALPIGVPLCAGALLVMVALVTPRVTAVLGEDR